MAIEAILRAGRAAIDELHRRLALRGHPDVRPALEATARDVARRGELRS